MKKLIIMALLLAPILGLCGSAAAQDSTNQSAWNKPRFSTCVPGQKYIIPDSIQNSTVKYYRIHQNWTQELSDSMDKVIKAESIIGAASCSLYVDNRPMIWMEWRGCWREMTWWEENGEELIAFLIPVGLLLMILFVAEARRELTI